MNASMRNAIIVESVGLRKYGNINFHSGEVQVFCPFHNHNYKSPSAGFNVYTGEFHCFACGKGFKDAKRLARKLGGEIDKEIITRKGCKQKENDDWKVLLKNPLALDHPYLSQRNVGNDLVERFKIRFDDDGIIIPLPHTNGRIVGVIKRFFSKKPKYMCYGWRTPIFPLNEHNTYNVNDKVFLVEGIFGVLRCLKYGIPSFAALGSGSLKEDVAKYLHNYQVLGLFDNDFAGYVAGGRLLHFLPNSKIVIPGMEVDEVSEVSLRTIYENPFTTRRISKLAKLSNNELEFRANMPKT